MATTTNDSARSGKTETLNEVLIRLGYLQSEQATQDDVLVAVLTRIQHMRVPKFNHNFLMAEHWDWLVVLQCLQDHHMFKSNPKRPPLAAFEKWLRQHRIPQELAHCTMREMSFANAQICGERYPWTDVPWEPHVLVRWRILYRTLNAMLSELQQAQPVQACIKNFIPYENQIYTS